MDTTHKHNIVIVGAGHAAGQFVQSLRQHEFSGTITLIGDEPSLPYQRPPLSKKFLSGELTQERLLVKPATAYSDVDTQLNTRVRRIDRDNQQIEVDGGVRVRYDTLVLAVGARPRRLAISGGDLPGISYLRTIQDVEAIRSSLDASSRVAIVGAGYIGLEVAAVLKSLGHDVTVIEAQDRVMSRVVAPEVSLFYQQVHGDRGVRLMLSTHIEGFYGNDKVAGVQLADGRQVEADTVIVGVGVAANTELAEEAELAVGNGITVDSRCQTSDARVFAIGDCTWHPNPIYGHHVRLESVHNALEQAKTAAANVCGASATYAQVPWFWSDQYDLKLQIAGLSQGHDRVVVRGDLDSGSFSCLYLQENRLLAIDAINRPRDFMQAKAQLIENRAKIDINAARDADTPLSEAVRSAS